MTGPAGPDDAPPPQKGILRDWLLIGPFPVADSAKDFAREQIAGEDKLQPAVGGKALAGSRLFLRSGAHLYCIAYR